MEHELDIGRMDPRAIRWIIRKGKKMEMKFAMTLQEY